MASMLNLAQAAAAEVYDSFTLYQRSFRRITACAKGRFEQRDWHGHERDSIARLDLYKRVVDRAVYDTRNLLSHNVRTKGMWAEMRAAFSGLIAGRVDIELAETFFNSITRRIFATVGVDPGIEFVDSDFALPHDSVCPVTHAYRHEPLPALLARVLLDLRYKVPYRDLHGDARLAAAQIEAHLAARWGATGFETIELIASPFYRNKAAYLVGRICTAAGDQSPRHCPAERRGRYLRGRGAADRGRREHRLLVYAFLFPCRRRLPLPGRRLPQIDHAAEASMPSCTPRSVTTSTARRSSTATCTVTCRTRTTGSSWRAGDKGMVMAVFTMPSFDVVFKVIKDAFPHPKRTTRADVQARYQLVFNRDRAGRLIDAQEFEHLAFHRSRFTEEALAELLHTSGNTVSVLGDTVDIKHLYTERRLTPLNLYLREQPEHAVDAVLDYGQAIKDMAATNIFPGDLFLKNFGVTRHGRVVFYDYDELCLLNQCNFRVIPESRDAYDDFGDAQPWFSVAENDVFPEEFRAFLGLEPRLADAFRAAHSDLFEATWWRNMQIRHRAGEVLDIFPYPPSKRLARER